MVAMNYGHQDSTNKVKLITAGMSQNKKGSCYFLLRFLTRKLIRKKLLTNWNLQATHLKNFNIGNYVKTNDLDINVALNQKQLSEMTEQSLKC